MNRMLTRRLLIALSLLWFTLLTIPVFAQVLDYGTLTGTTGRSSAPLQSTPLQSTPLPSTQPGSASAAQYGASAEEYAGLSAKDSALAEARQQVQLFRARLVSMIHRLPEAWGEIKTALAIASPTGRPSYFIGIAVFAVLLLVVGRAVTELYNVFLARRFFVAAQRSSPQGYAEKLPVLAYRIFLTTIGVVATIAVAAAVGLVFDQEHEATQITSIVVFLTYGAVIMNDTVWRMTLSPYMSEYRLPQIGDHEARALYRGLSAIGSFGLLTIAFAYWMQALGLSSEVHVALMVILSLITVLMALALIRVHRDSISNVLLAGRSRDQVSLMTLAAVVLWGPLSAIYLILTWGDMAFRLIMGVETGPQRLVMPFLIFMAGILVYAITAYIIERVFARAREIREINQDVVTEELASTEPGRADGADTDGDGDEEGGGPAAELEARIVRPRRPGMRTMEDLARRIASLFAIGASAYFLVRFWAGADVFDRNPWLNTLEDLIDTIFLGYIVYHATRIWIDQKIEEEGGDELPAGPLEGEGGGAGATRLATLLPLIRNFILVVIATAVALVAASELGVNVAPLFAGAGIVGLAVGFGSQTLVRDILSGAFFLLDDAFRKGEYIDVGEVKGTVEKISLRSFQLRHHLGYLHTIPFGEIQYLTNFSRDWVMMKLPLRLTYDTDVEKVRKLVKKLGLRLLEDPEIGDKFIQPVKSQGVIQMDDSAMIVRIKFMTYPGEQWVLRKRIYAEIRELFAAEGIKFAHREVTVRIPDLDKKDELSEGQIQAIGAAARRATDAVDEEMLTTGTGGAGEVR